MYRRKSAAAPPEFDRKCFLGLLQLCNSYPKLAQLHALILKSGHQNDRFLLTKFISVSSSSSYVHHACSLAFSGDRDFCDAFLFNTVIKAYAETPGHEPTAVGYYNEMLFRGLRPTRYTYPFVFKACSGTAELDPCRSLHSSVVKLGFCLDAYVLNAMLHAYCCCCCCQGGGISYARKVFDEMPESEQSVPWNILMGGYLKCKMPNEVIDLFREMQSFSDTVKPDEITMVMLLSACSHLGSLKLGTWAESFIDREEESLSSELYNALIDMFSKCGDVDRASTLLKTMPPEKRTIVSWTSVISGMSIHGRGRDAASLFEELIAGGGARPDGATFVALLSACGRCGLVEEGKRYFEAMAKDYGIVPGIEHYGCMVDMLSRAGMVDEAVGLVEGMPVEPNAVIRRMVVAACREDGRLKVGETMGRDLVEREPMEEANHVLLSSFYVEMAEWEKKVHARAAMGKNDIRKMAGYAVVE